jgi:hypothetical protein
MITLLQRERHGCQHHHQFHFQFQDPAHPDGQQDLAPGPSYLQVHVLSLPRTTLPRFTLHQPVLTLTLTLDLLRNRHTDTNIMTLKRPMYFLWAASTSRSLHSSSNGPPVTSQLTALLRTRLLVVAVAYPTHRSTRILDKLKAG